MASETRQLVEAYIQAVGERRLKDLRPLVEPNVEFTLGDTTVSGADAFISAFGRVAKVVVRNDIRKIFVDGDEAVVIYDFVTDTPVGAVPSVEYITTRNGRIASSLLVFERLHWAEVLAEMARREAAVAAVG